MKELELKLSEWHRLHTELGTAERLLAESSLQGAHQENERLRAEAARLQLETEEAFQALSAALVANREASEPR